MNQALVLASESPRRRELLTQAGFDLTVCSAHVPEAESGDPRTLVLQNALAKANAVRTQYPDGMILGADTVVAVDGQVFGKPKDASDACRMLRLLSGRWHQVYTGVALIGPDGSPVTRCAVTDVHFVEMTQDEIATYISTGEPFDKAGAYAIQGRAGYFIDRISGSYSNVIGLPLATVREMMREYQASAMTDE